MRKKSLALLLAGLLVIALAACGGGESATTPAPNNEGSTATNPPASTTEAPAATEAPANSGSQVPDTYVFQSNGCSIYIDQDMAEVLSALGEPKSYFEAASCAFEGLDKTYTYGGFIITTRPEGDKDYVNSIELTDDSVTTPEGVYIGCTADEVQSMMSEATPFGTALVCTKGGTTLQFVMENDVVTSICYLPDKN